MKETCRVWVKKTGKNLYAEGDRVNISHLSDCATIDTVDGKRVLSQ